MERSQINNDVNDVSEGMTEEFQAESTTNNVDVVHENDIGDPDTQLSKMIHKNIDECYTKCQIYLGRVVSQKCYNYQSTNVGECDCMRKLSSPNIFNLACRTLSHYLMRTKD